MATIIAIGILYMLLPMAMKTLRFRKLGPYKGKLHLAISHIQFDTMKANVPMLVPVGSFAALWQPAFLDAEAGTLFSYLQSLGMKGGQAMIRLGASQNMLKLSKL